MKVSVPQALPPFDPSGLGPRTEPRCLELERHREKYDILGIHPKVRAELDRPIRPDLITVRICRVVSIVLEQRDQPRTLVLLEQLRDLARRRGRLFRTRGGREGLGVAVVGVHGNIYALVLGQEPLRVLHAAFACDQRVSSPSSDRSRCARNATELGHCFLHLLIYHA
ncbi:uncharacterized protein SCHCODRAFT_02639476 [Schizophyllum commune H4-8]|uniref:uncharacterized protein n=1 Tax=Schizophyllum commune (strain H4-8 / FGSC 9210) TaxID=578458 RepID=UPI00215E57AC|nr:uncharacterized protein SCHCODRAFT_02639476 [Schizophyllum commune H4-8]KAI5888001.1 hypothetical protein SCHCODRAFT_02639476 [Schizophyllum commune H4-8]